MKHSIPSHPFGQLWGDLAKFDKKYYQGKLTLKQLSAKVSSYRKQYQKSALGDESRQQTKYARQYGLILSKVIK
jgi:hypothetical protein